MGRKSSFLSPARSNILLVAGRHASWPDTLALPLTEQFIPQMELGFSDAVATQMQSMAWKVQRKKVRPASLLLTHASTPDTAWIYPHMICCTVQIMAAPVELAWVPVTHAVHTEAPAEIVKERCDKPTAAVSPIRCYALVWLLSRPPHTYWMLNADYSLFLSCAGDDIFTYIA